MSPSQKSVTMKQFGFKIPHTLFRKLEKLAESNGIPVSVQINRIVRNAVINIELDEEDEAIIDQRVIEEAAKVIRYKRSK